MGPWRHSGVNYDGTSLGPLKWEGDTALQFRRDVLKPFFDQYLKDGAAKADTPPVLIYNTGENHWDRLTAWPLACAEGCGSKSRPLYLASGGGLSFAPPASGPTDAAVATTSTSPIRPSRCRICRARSASRDGERWRTWLLADQRFVADRPDVVSYTTPS